MCDRKHEMFNQCWLNVGPASQPVAQHCANIGWTSRVCWDVRFRIMKSCVNRQKVKVGLNKWEYVILRMVRSIKYDTAPPPALPSSRATGFEIWALVVGSRARYLSVTVLPTIMNCYRWTSKKHLFLWNQNARGAWTRELRCCKKVNGFWSLNDCNNT